MVSLDLLQMHSVTTKHSDMFEFWFESWRNAVNFDFVLLPLPAFTGEFPGVSLFLVSEKNNAWQVLFRDLLCSHHHFPKKKTTHESAGNDSKPLEEDH